MQLDAHQHFWHYNPARDLWIDESMEILKRDFLPADLKPLLDDHGFEGCIAVQADQSEEETSFLLKLAEQNDFIKGVVGWADLRSPDIKARLDHFSKHKKLKGFRHILQAEPAGFMLRDDFVRGVEALGEYAFTYDILINSSQLSEAVELTKRFPEQPFVLDHLGKPDIKGGEFTRWKHQINRLAEAPNVYCKISGLVTEAHWHNWENDIFKNYIDHIFDAFGGDRLMFGSDWPVCLLSASYNDTVSIITDYLDNFSEEEKSKVMGETAAKFYNIFNH